MRFDTRLTDDDGCFACGKNNAAGLHMEFEPGAEPGSVCARAFIHPRFQGWQGITHGGILATLLDDAMAYVGVAVLDRPGVMARLQLRFRKPAPVGKTVMVRARVLHRRGGLLGLEGQVVAENGELLVSAEGTFVGKERLTAGEAKSEEDGH